MPLLQESQAGRGFNKIKQVESDDTLPMSTGTSFAGLHANSLLTPTQLLAASQTAALMAASAGLPVSLHATLSSNAGLFHPGLFGPVWPTSPQSPPSGPGSPLSPNSKMRKNNNNNVVSSSSGDHAHALKVSLTERRKTVRKLQEIVERSPPTVTTDIVAPSGQLSPPTSGSSPPSSTSEPMTNIKEPNRDKQFVCGVCNRSFGYKHVLQNHERTHTGEKPFECPECHKRFTRDHHLKTHMRLHTGERPYHCDHCDRHFVQVANLRRHLRVHTGERPYNCKECSARFSDSNQLKAHVLIHKGEKPFHCDRCQGRFRRRHHLMHHKCGMLPITVTNGGGSGSGGCGTGSTTTSPEIGNEIDGMSNDVQTQVIQDTNAATNRIVAPDDYHDDECPEDLSGHKEKNRDRKSQEIRRHMIRMPPVTPLITLPLHVSLPEQTEPEDLSMNATRHNTSRHSRGSSSHSHQSSHSVSPPLSSRSACSDNQDIDEGNMMMDEVDDDELDEAATLFLKRHPHRRQHHENKTTS